MSPPTTSPPVPARRRGRETVRDMVLSLAVLLVLVVGFVALLPKHHQSALKAVDFSEQVQLLSARAPFPVEAPGTLPAGVTPNFARSGLDPATLHIGLVVAGVRFARLDEAASPDTAFFRDAAVGPATGRTVVIAGRTWQVHADAATDGKPGSGTALVRDAGGGAVVTISDGGGSGRATPDEITAIAQTLRVVPRPAG